MLWSVTSGEIYGSIKKVRKLKFCHRNSEDFVKEQLEIGDQRRPELSGDRKTGKWRPSEFYWPWLKTTNASCVFFIWKSVVTKACSKVLWLTYCRDKIKFWVRVSWVGEWHCIMLDTVLFLDSDCQMLHDQLETNHIP